MISLQSYPFWRYGSSVGVVGVGNILVVISDPRHTECSNLTEAR